MAHIHLGAWRISLAGMFEIVSERTSAGPLSSWPVITFGPADILTTHTQGTRPSAPDVAQLVRRVTSVGHEARITVGLDLVSHTQQQSAITLLAGVSFIQARFEVLEVSDDVIAFEQRWGPLSDAVPAVFANLEYGRLYDMTAGSR